MEGRTRWSLFGRKLEGTGFTRTRHDRHIGVDLIALRKRRAKNKVARRQRRVNRIRSAR